jgi:hypothetical protein
MVSDSPVPRAPIARAGPARPPEPVLPYLGNVRAAGGMTAPPDGHIGGMAVRVAGRCRRARLPIRPSRTALRGTACPPDPVWCPFRLAGHWFVNSPELC